MKKKLITRIILLIVLLAAIGASVYVMTAPDEVEAQRASRGSFKDYAKENGVVKRYEEQTLMSEVEGEVTEVLVNKNDQVKKGQVLARISAADYQSGIAQADQAIAGLEAQKDKVSADARQSRLELSAQVSELQAQIDKVKDTTELERLNGMKEMTPGSYLELVRAQYSVAGAAVNEAKTRYDLAKTAKDEGEIDESAFREIEANYYEKQNQWMEAKNKFDSTNGQAWDYVGTGQNPQSKDLNRDYYNYTLDSAQRDIAILETQIKGIKSRMGDEAETAELASIDAQIAAQEEEIKKLTRKIEACEVKATSDGLISDVPVKNMSKISEGDTLAVIRQEQDKCLVECAVRTEVEECLKVGDPVRIIRDTKQGEQVMEGEITQISDYAEETISSLGMKEYKTGITVTCPADSDLKDGYQVTAQFMLYSADDVLLIPISALYKVNGHYAVLKIEKGHTVSCPVTVAYKGTELVEISEGLNEGDVYVTNVNINDISEDMRVKAVFEDEQ